ncbi:MAG TPA: MFS transporter [Solirubrobacteraceae bacterium]|nr:MFS transporter [Solirubrobacteraceae bacterium]
MHSIASTPRTLRLFAVSIVARVPEAMFSIALLVHARHLTGSFAAAGVVSGAYAVGLGVSGPVLGRLVDRRGQAAILIAAAAASTVLLVSIALLPVGAPVAVIVLLAGAIGLASPPVGACVRALYPGLAADSAALRATYAADASASELTWIAGPPAALALGALWSTAAALIAGGVVLLVATVAFAVQPASRAWRPDPAATSTRGGSLRAPAMRTLVVVFVAVGALFGAAEVAVTGAADALGSTTAAAPLLGLWGAGSLVGGVLSARFGRGTPSLTLVLGALAAGHLALAAAAGSLVALAVVLFLAGAAIAPTYATVYALVDEAAPAGAVTEAFAWLVTAVAVGGAVGSAVAGGVVDGAGPAAAFVVAGGCGVVAVVTALLRARTLGGPVPAPAAA